MLAEALGLAASGGPAAVTMTAVADAAHAPSGSLYHRYKSRAELLADVWLTSVELFQRDFSAFAESAEDPGEVAAFVVRWARENRPQATVLAAHHASEFLTDEVAARRAKQARAVTKGLAALALRYMGASDAAALRRAVFAFSTVPLAALREPLRSGAPITDALEELVATAARAVIDSGRSR